MTALHERRGSEAGKRPAVRAEVPALSQLEFVGCTAAPMTRRAGSLVSGAELGVARELVVGRGRRGDRLALCGGFRWTACASRATAAATAGGEEDEAGSAHQCSGRARGSFGLARDGLSRVGSPRCAARAVPGRIGLAGLAAVRAFPDP